MSIWNTLPWNTIIAIIGISLLIPCLLAFICVRIKRYEDLGVAIGIFLIILGVVAYAYLIPQDIIQEAKLPEDYLWEDYGQVYYWERNGIFLQGKDQRTIPFALRRILPQRTPIERNFIAREVIHVSEYDKEENRALIHDVIYDDTGKILSVINNTEKVSEWYWVDPSMSSLKYINVNAGHMGIPAFNTDLIKVDVGWVDSNAEQYGKENVVLLRSMQRVQNGFIDGVEVAVWRSDVYNQPIIWHGRQYYCDETLQLTVNPKTGYVIHVYRHLVLSAHLSQFIELYYPSAMNSRVVMNYLKLNDPIGEAGELIYNTTQDSMNRHLAAVREINNLMTYVPLLICIPMLIIGIALTWRFFGRSYYWKRYKKHERLDASSQRRRKQASTRVKILAIGMCSILLVSSVLYFANQTTSDKKTDIQMPTVDQSIHISFQEDEPTPPGGNRVIDSGRHILLPTDEGVHKHSRREWWYFNVFFNDPGSDLQGYSLVVSFNTMKFFDIRFLRPDNLFILLFDDAGNSYDFNILNQRKGTLQAGASGVDVTFLNSWVKGAYPSWQIHAVNTEKKFVVDLVFTADFMPVWVLGRSANLAVAKYFSGDYYIPRCTVSGNISWEGKQYSVSGLGYHDHVWENVVPRWVSKGWDWANIHFDNGWEMYLSKFTLRAPFDLSAGVIIISPNNRNITEFWDFKLKYIQTANPKGLPFMTYPLKIHVEAKENDMVLKFDIEVYNMHEIVWKWARTGMFEGPCTAKGTFSWDGHTVELNGIGFTEFTRVKYILGLPGIIRK